MKRIACFMLIFCWLAVIAGCGSSPTIDASSEETLKQSISQVREALPESEQSKFDEALKTLVFDQLDMKDLFLVGAGGGEGAKAKVFQSLDGKTGEQVIAEALRIEVARTWTEIQELETKKAEADKAREELKKFEVVRPDFSLQDREYLDPQPVIRLSVKNGTKWAVSRAYFVGTIATPGRSVPWFRDTFNYTIPGGLEPGESDTWYLAPNVLSDWGKAEQPIGSVFTVTVERIDGADGEPIYSTQMFSEEDRKHLDKLKSEYSIE